MRIRLLRTDGWGESQSWHQGEDTRKVRVTEMLSVVEVEVLVRQGRTEVGDNH